MEIIITYYILHCGLYELQVFCYYYVYQWLRHYTCSGFCKTSYHLLISPPPTNLPNTLKIHTGENKIDRYTRYFPTNGSTNPECFQLKTFSIPRGIISQNFSSLGFAVSEELGNKHTDSLTDQRFDREIFWQQIFHPC